jgi:aryl-alcohol dehydrogenase-like predicted oxidoreductase
MTSTYTFEDGFSVRRAAELGVTFFDTADAYDLGLNEELLAEALHPYPELLVATKCGQARPSRGEWVPLGRPEYLRQRAEVSLRRLRVDHLGLLLHRLDPAGAARGAGRRARAAAGGGARSRGSGCPRSASRSSKKPGPSRPSRACRTATT